MPKYMLRPTEFEAVQYTYENKYKAKPQTVIPGGGFWDLEMEYNEVTFVAKIETLDGQVRLEKGDWIVTGPTGVEVYKPEAFSKKFEPFTVPAVTIKSEKYTDTRDNKT